ncbi:DNA polymerase [Acrocarpospora sp. B8E8]|uniref:DNA polymerase n=1 Tax=Acrocarpospora sp. B8E8 TaxID=3153572 RepID=UPI00325F7DB5
MRQIPWRVAGQEVVVNVAEGEEDILAFREFVTTAGPLAFDTETTGLDIYASDCRVRLAQFGTGRTAWVLPVESGPQWADLAAWALRTAERLYCHNATFDLLVADAHLRVPLEVTYLKTVDVRIMAHLTDPRSAHEGGTGHSLEALTRAHLDAEVADQVKGAMRELARELKTTKGEIFRIVPLDHPRYLLYAGMDVLLTSRLFEHMLYSVPHASRRLVVFEHQVAYVCAIMERKGFLVDIPYTLQLADRLERQAKQHADTAAALGVDNVNSTDQVAQALTRRGAALTETTATGKPKVDKAILDRLVADGDELAIAVQRAKRASKWKTTYADTFLELADPGHRIHCGINSLAARTARMSITRPALQTLPSGEHMIRSCYLAEEGEVIISVDYQAIELRVLAALAGERKMIEAIRAGKDLHGLTASLVFGPDYSDTQRKAAKILGFGKVYGGGPATLARQTGLSVADARRVVAAYDEGYPAIARYTKQLQADLPRQGFAVVTGNGRRLPVDRAKPYAALNFMIQSTARDMLAAGLLEIHKQGLLDYLRLPVHDEVIASAPAEDAKEVAHALADAMAGQINGVPLATEAEIGGRSWGSLYT